MTTRSLKYLVIPPYLRIRLFAFSKTLDLLESLLERNLLENCWMTRPAASHDKAAGDLNVELY